MRRAGAMRVYIDAQAASVAAASAQVSSDGSCTTTSQTPHRRRRSTLESVTRRMSNAQVHAARLHTELRDSVCARRLTVALLLVALAASIAVPVAQAAYRESVSQETVALMVKGAAASAAAEIRPVFASKDVPLVLKYAADSGWLRGPMDADRFEQIVVPHFVEHQDLLQLHVVHSQTKGSMVFWTGGASGERMYTTDLRWYRSPELQERQQRMRAARDDVTTYTETPVAPHAYDPEGEQWYAPALSQTEERSSWQVAADTARDGSATSVILKASSFPWPAAIGGKAVVCLKFSSAALAKALATLNVGPRGNAYVVTASGDVVAGRNSGVVSVDADGGLVKIWDIEAEPELKALSPSELQRRGNGHVGEHCDHQLLHVAQLGGVPGFYLLIIVHPDDFLVRSRSLNTIVTLLSAASVVVLVCNLIKLVSGLVLMAAHRYQERSVASRAVAVASSPGDRPAKLVGTALDGEKRRRGPSVNTMFPDSASVSVTAAGFTPTKRRRGKTAAVSPGRCISPGVFGAVSISVDSCEPSRAVAGRTSSPSSVADCGAQVSVGSPTSPPAIDTSPVADTVSPFNSGVTVARDGTTMYMHHRRPRSMVNLVAGDAASGETRTPLSPSQNAGRPRVSPCARAALGASGLLPADTEFAPGRHAAAVSSTRSGGSRSSLGVPDRPHAL